MSSYRKTLTAVVGALMTFAGVVITSDADPVTASEWLLLAGGILTALGVYGVPNDAPSGEPADPHLSERGQVSVLAAVLIVILILILLGVLR